MFNVLFYFDATFRTRAEEWALRTLRPGGLFLCGADGNLTFESRYSVYRNESGNLVPKEFAFSLDNLRPPGVMPWFCLHNEEKETFTLARLIGILRSDESFRLDYDSRVDELLAENRIFVRQEDGFLAAASDQLPISEWAGGLHRHAKQVAAGRLHRPGCVCTETRRLQRMDKPCGSRSRGPTGHCFLLIYQTQLLRLGNQTDIWLR